MPTCANHSDRESVAQCSRCGAYLCQECVAPGDGDVLCFDCSIARAKDELSHQHAARPEPAQQRNGPHRISGPLRLMLVFGAVIVAAELAIVVFMGPHVQTRTAATAAAVKPKKQAIAQAGADTLLISQALEAYRKQHNAYPPSLSAIANALPPELRATIDDPSTIYTRSSDGRYTLHFKGHGPASLTIDSSQPVPRLTEVQP